MKQVARSLRNHQAEILNWFRAGSTISAGVNNKIRTLQRTAYGDRDKEYFRLKLHALHTIRYALIG